MATQNSVGTGLAGQTGTGAFVGATSPTLVTPNLGTPSAINLSNASGTLPSGVTGNITTLGTQTAALNMGTHQINAVVDPSLAQDAATKNYVDSVVAGLNPNASTYGASTANLAGYTYNNGTAGVGATLTAGAPGVFTQDGIAIPAGERWLYKNDTTGSGAYNGVYVVTVAGDGATAAVLTRAADYDTPENINNSGLIPVQFGTVNAGTGWLQTATVTIVGTTPLVYVQFGQTAGVIAVASGGTGLSSTTANSLLYSPSSGTIAYLASANTAVLTTNASGVPSLTAATGTGAPVLATSPTLVTPNLGTPSSITLTNATGLVPSTGLSATGTPSATSYLRGDNSWSTIADQTGITWQSTGAATTQAIAINNGYFTQAVGITLTLPATAVVGAEVYVSASGAGVWTIAQNAGQNIQFGSLSTTVGVGGSLASTSIGDTVRLICSVANTTWQVIGSQGNITIV